MKKLMEWVHCYGKKKINFNSSVIYLYLVICLKELFIVSFNSLIYPIFMWLFFSGGKGADNNLNSHKNGSKRDGLNFNLNKSTSQNLRIEPGGLIVLGKKGVTLNCLPGNNHNVSWLYNGEPAPPCGVARCKILDNGSLHFYKVHIFILALNVKNKTVID